MNVLDENIPESQRQLLRGWRIKVSQIGYELGRLGMKDEEIIPLLHKTGKTTFFTRDLGFYDKKLCHGSYCIVCLEVGKEEVASFVRRFLKHPATRTRAKRMGKVIKAGHTGMRFWRLNIDPEGRLTWSKME